MSEDFSSLSGRLKFALKIIGISQTELAKRINVKPQVIQYLCSSGSQKSRFTFEIAGALDIDFAWLATGNGLVPHVSNFIKHQISVPLLTFDQIRGWKISGKDLDITEVSEWVSVDDDVNLSSFAVKINDRAMAPRFDLNTIVIIDPLETNKLERNCFILVYMRQEDFIIFRQLIVINQDKLLVAINKTLHKDILLKEEDVVLGICKQARWSV